MSRRHRGIANPPAGGHAGESRSARSGGGGACPNGASQTVPATDPPVVASGHGFRLLVRRRSAPGPLRRHLHPRDHRAGRGQLRLHRGRPEDPGLHLGPDERDPRPLPSRDRRHRPAPDRHPRPPVQRHAVAPGGGTGPPAGRLAAGAAGEGAAADHRRGGERGRAADGQAGHRQARDRVVRRLLARHDRRRGGRHLQRRPARLRADGRQPRHPDPEQLPPRLRHRRRRASTGSGSWTGPSRWSTPSRWAASPPAWWSRSSAPAA